MKTCSNCKEEKPLKSFSKDKSRKDGFEYTCKSCGNTAREKYYKANKEVILAKGRERYFNNHDNEKQRSLRWARSNKVKNTAKTMRYNANKLQAIPSWVGEEEEWLIEEVYDLSKLRTELTGLKHHVDHIAPLQGRTVCGLHTIDNLQVLTASHNQSKGNRYGLVE